jgi:hypothetical protein
VFARGGKRTQRALSVVAVVVAEASQHFPVCLVQLLEMGKIMRWSQVGENGNNEIFEV